MKAPGLPVIATRMVAERERIDGPRIFCRVTDTGVGMPNDVRQHIFDPLFMTKREQNPGFGLSGVHAIVGRQGGEIIVESELGKGTTFTIWLPVSKPKRPLQSSPSSTPCLHPHAKANAWGADPGGG